MKYKYKDLYFLLFFILPLCLLSCVTPPPASYSLSEMSLQEVSEEKAESLGLALQNFTYDQIRSFNVLVLDSENAKVTDEYLVKGEKYHKISSEKIRELQYNALREVFYMGDFDTEYKNKQYDLIILRDASVKPGSTSGTKVEMNVTLYFVYPTNNLPQFTGSEMYVIRGQSSAQGIGVIPYPAANDGVKEAAENCAENIKVSLKNGISVLTLKDGQPVKTESPAKVGSENQDTSNSLIGKQEETGIQSDSIENTENQNTESQNTEGQPADSRKGTSVNTNYVPKGLRKLLNK